MQFPESPCFIRNEFELEIRAKSYANLVNRRALIAFACCQFAAIMFMLVAVRFIRSDWGAPLFIVGFVGLLPGDYLSVLLVGRLFWSRITLHQMSALEIATMVLVNGIVWWSLSTACRYI